MFLATTALKEFWDTNDEIVFLGPWCLLHERKAEWQALRYSILPDPWPTASAVAQADEYCAQVLESILPRLTSALNQIHGVSFSDRYWRIIVGPWLLWYVHAFYDRYASIRSAFRAHPALRSTALHPDCYTTPVDAADFVRLAYLHTADVFNFQLYSQALRALHLPSGSVTDVRLHRESANQMTEKTAPDWMKTSPLRTLIRRAIPSFVRALKPSVMIGDLDLSSRERARFLISMARHGWAMPVPDVHRQVTATPSSMRAELVDRCADRGSIDDFSRVVVETLKSNFPTLYLEGYAAFRSACQAAWPSAPRVVIGATAWAFNEPFKFLAAESTEHGSRSIDVQHGGGYGMCAVMPLERLARTVADRWLTYGWRDNRDGKTEPMPHARFVPPAKSNAPRETRRIVLVAASLSRYRPRFETFAPFEAVFDWRCRFIRALSSAARDRLQVRLHLDFGWAQKQRLEEACGPIATMESNAPLIASSHSDLLVVEYPGTAFLEAIASGAPTIGLWDPVIWAMRPEAAPSLDDLRRVGILCDTPEQAAAIASEVQQTVSDWWQRADVQAAKSRFVEQFARGSERWITAWTDLLEREVTLAGQAITTSTNNPISTTRVGPEDVPNRLG